MKTLIGLLLPFILLSSCLPEKDNEIRIDEKYVITLPSFLTKGNDLNNEASLQYQNLMKEFYVIVIDESVKDFENALAVNNLSESIENNIEAYSDLVLKGFEATLRVKKKSKDNYTTINGMPARLLTINATIDGLDAYYSIAFIKGEKNYYQIMTWTLEKHEGQYKEKMDKILRSLKEL